MVGTLGDRCPGEVSIQILLMDGGLTVRRRLQKYTRRKEMTTPMFALGVLPLRHCEWNGERVLSYEGKRVEVQVCAGVQELNFHTAGGSPPEYEISVGFIRPRDREAFGELIRYFRPRRECLGVLV